MQEKEKVYNRILKIIWYLEQVGLDEDWRKLIHTEENIHSFIIVV